MHGSIDPGALIAIIAVAIGFVVVATLLGSWITPKVLDRLARRARTDGTVMALGLAVALGFARLASAAQLAPIVGAFVAGLAVGRSEAPGIDWERVRRSIEAMLAHGPGNGGLPAPIEGTVEIDNLASPWHSIVEVRAHDRAGLLFRVASALSHSGLQIHQASIATRGELAVDTFWVTGPRGSKLDQADERTLRAAFAGKTSRRWSRVRAGRPDRIRETRP